MTEELIGQDNAVQYLMNLERAPNFLLIVGSVGSGKRTLVDWYMNVFLRAEHEIITDLKVDSIRAIIESCMTLRARKYFILPDVQHMNIQAQNALLKTLEQPPANAHFIMTVNSVQNILSTIKSRSSILTMGAYTREELEHATGSTNNKLLDFCVNIGQIRRYENMQWEELLDHCEKVVDNLSRINLANIFNILKKVEESNYDLIIPLMEQVFRRKMANDNVIAQLRVLQVTRSLLENSATINVKNALEVMFMKLWEVA
jgi:DNA polymerase III delta prime subunit